MDVLRQLIDDARGVLKEMSTTQRVAMMMMVVTVGSLLLFVVYIGSGSQEKGVIALPLPVEPQDSKEIIEKLKAAGYGPLEYNLEDKRVLVPMDQAQKALLYLAQENLLPRGGAGLEEMLDKMSFSDPTVKSKEMLLAGRRNEVIRLIQMIDSVKEAKVIYSDEARNSLFGPPMRQKASVIVQTKLGRELTQKEASTIIALVAAAKAGLDPAQVEVADQHGRHFRSETPDSLDALATNQYMLEKQRNDALRDKIENLCRAAIPRAEVWAFVDHRLNMNKRHNHTRTYSDGPKTRERSEKRDMHSLKAPPAETGARPNVGRASQVAGAMTEETTESMKIQSRDYQPSVADNIIEFAPEIESLTISAVVHLPFQYGEELKDDKGQPILDELTGQPKRKLESAPALTPEKEAELKRSIYSASGIFIGQERVSVEVMQVPWTAPLEVVTPKPPAAQQAYEWLKTNLFPLVIFFGLLFSVYVIYSQAKRAVPAEELELPGEDLLSLSMGAPPSEADQKHAQYESMRNKISELVSDDPKKAANLVKKWMRRENF